MNNSSSRRQKASSWVIATLMAASAIAQEGPAAAEFVERRLCGGSVPECCDVAAHRGTEFCMFHKNKLPRIRQFATFIESDNEAAG